MIFANHFLWSILKLNKGFRVPIATYPHQSYLLMLQHRSKLKIYLQDFLIAVIIIIIHFEGNQRLVNLPCGLRLPPLHVYICYHHTDWNVDIDPHVDGPSGAQLGELEVIGGVFEGVDKKSKNIQVLVLNHSACPYQNYCLKYFLVLQSFFRTALIVFCFFFQGHQHTMVG